MTTNKRFLPNINIPYGLQLCAAKSVWRMKQFNPEFTQETLDYFYNGDPEDNALLAHVSICIALLQPCKPVQIRGNGGLYTASERHHIERWLVQHTDVDHYYLPRQALTIAAQHDFPLDAKYTKIVDFNQQYIGYRQRSLEQSCKRSTVDIVTNSAILD